MKQVEFFFDVGSPYSYLAYHQQVRSSEDDNKCAGTRAQLRC